MILTILYNKYQILYINLKKHIKNSKKTKMAMHSPILLFILVTMAKCFEFKSPYISVNPTTINTYAQYTINLQRQFAQNVSNTAWNTSIVPSGSTMTVAFPVEFTLNGAQSCDIVMLSGNLVTGYSCFINMQGNIITINNAIPTSQYISDVTIIISNVLNPSPAITTSAFLATIGVDYSANDPFSAVSLTPDVFNSATIGFNPVVVNTTGDMIVTLVNTNKLPAGSYIMVKFPNNLAWAEDVAANNHKLPITSTMSCTSLSPTINTGITCSGQSSTQIVTITNLSNIQIPPLSNLKFSINSLFSPPTQSQADIITITSLISGNQYDTINTPITGLVAKNLTDLSIVTTTTTKTINTNIGLRLYFTLQDTITNADYFQISFPLGTVITYSTSLSSFSLAGNVSYNVNSSVLTFYQTTLSQTRHAGFYANITFLTFRTPNSTKPTDPIVFRVMKNGSAKMRGSGVFVAESKQYTFTATPNDTNINANIIYQINFNLADPIDRTGYIILTLPPELILASPLTCTINSSSTTSINSNPTLTSINSTTYRISNLNRTATSLVIPIQSLTITLIGLQLPNSIRNISSFGLSVYFGVEGYLNAIGSQSNTVATVGGVLTANVGLNTTVTASLGTMVINMTLQNSIPANGYIYVIVPTEVSLATLSSAALMLTSTNATISITTTINQPTISLRLTNQLPSSSSVTLTLTSITTPISTARTSNFTIYTTNQNNLTIDTMATNISSIMTQPTQLSTINISRGSGVNYDTTPYMVGLGLNFNLFGITGNFILAQFPVEISVQNISSLSVSLIAPDNTSSALSYNIISTSPLKISISLPISTVTISHTLLFANLTNPYSLKQSTVGIIITVGFNRTQNSTVVTYLYAKSESIHIQNSQATNFLSLDYAYSSGVLFSQGNLVSVIGLVVGNRVAVLSYQLDSNILFKNSSALTTCSSPQITITCTITSVNPAIVQITPTSAGNFSLTNITITIGVLLTPTTYLVSYPATILTSFDNANYVISRNTATIKFTPSCTRPCRQCQTNLPTNCLSCYNPSQNITNLVYFANITNQTYGQCYSACPTGYTSNPNNTYLCLKCDTNCLQCINTSTTCTSCPNVTYLYLSNNSCLTGCPNGTYGSSISGGNVCVNCTTGCDLCASGTSCTKCSTGYFLYNNVCNTSCPINSTVANSTARTCDSCSISCLTCQGSISNCTSCTAGLVLNNGTCQSSCSNISMIPINGTCTACASSCLTCSITTSNCTSCITNTTLRYLSNGQCLSSCPSTFYASITTGYICTLCSSLPLNCNNCTSTGTACLSCDSGFVFFNNTQCLNYVPNGYVNISGNATPCSSPCVTCSITTTNCTSCASPLIYYTNQCLSSCPNATTIVNGSCQACSPSCSQCSNNINYCTSCSSPLFLNSITHQCVNSSSGCQNYTYANSTTNTCTQCVSPCLSCVTAASCSSCLHGYYFQSVTTLCLDVCPLGWVGVVDICVRCISPCRYCQASPDNCTSCISGYYLNIYTYQCLLQCPPQVTISNPITMTCDTCVTPCLTCQNQTTICTSCRPSTYLLGTQCLTNCPSGYYGNLVTKVCTQCFATCQNCTISATQCTSCPASKYLYNSTCVSQCPATNSIIINNTCTPCSSLLQYCLTCTSTRSCMACQSPKILLNGQCYTQCPTGYTYKQDLGTCVTTSQSNQQTTQQQLNTTLSSSSVFPMPFTCIGLSLFIACIMSKLQNKNTYLIGAAYSLSGLLQTSSLIFLIIKYLNYNKSLQATTSQIPSVNQFPLLTVGLIIIYVCNLIGLVAQTPILCSDEKFSNWLKNTTHRCLFILTTLLSFAINYKIKLILFCKLFSFTTTRAQLESTQKFKIFNILSFIGVSHEIFIIYMSIIMIMKLKTTIINNEIFLVFIDVMVICFISIVLSIVANKKEDDFFSELADNGYVLNKRIIVEGEDMCKDGLEPKYLKGDQNKLKNNHMDSFQKILDNNNQEQIYEDQELSLSISENRSDVDRKQKQRNRNRRNQKDKTSQLSQNDNTGVDRIKISKKINKNQLHFTNQQTSNPIKKQPLHKDQQLNQLQNRHSVIFENNIKQYNQQQVISKNQTVLLESPPKSTKTNKSGHTNKSITNKINNHVGRKQNDMVIFDEMKEEDDGIQDSIKLEKKDKGKDKDNLIDVQGDRRQKLGIINDAQHNTSKNIQDNSQRLIGQGLVNNSLGKVPTVVVEKQKQKEQQKEKIQKQRVEKLRKQNETKIFREQKNINKDDQDSEQIQAKIKKKLDELQGLKRQNSSHDLRKSRQNSREKSKAGNNKEPDIFKLFSSSNKGQKIKVDAQINTNDHNIQPQSQNKLSSHIPPTPPKKYQQPNTPNTLYHNFQQKIEQNQSQSIPQASILIKQTQELKKQKQLPQQKRHETIRQQIDVNNSLAVSKLEQYTKKGQGNEKTENNQKESQLDFGNQFIEEKLIPAEQNKSKKLKTHNNSSIIENQSIKNVKNPSQKVETLKEQNKSMKTNQQIKQQIPLTQQNKASPENSKKKQNIQNMYDSFIKNNDDQDEFKKSVSTKKQQQIDDQVRSHKNQSTKLKIKTGVDIAIGQQMQIDDVEELKKDKKRRNKGNIFEFEQEEESMQDSGLEDSRPDMDEEINHHPLKSSFATQRRSIQNQNSEENTSAKHPLIGILQQGVSRNQIPKMADEDENSNREDLRTKMMRYEGKPQQKTQRRQHERPPLQRPVSTQKNKIYAAGLRQFQDQTLTKKNSYENTLNQQAPEMPNKKRNNSLYSVPLNKLQSRESKDITCSDHTQDMIIKPGYFNQNSSSENTSFANPKYTSTMIIDSGNQMPDKPTIGFTSRTSFNNRVSTSHDRVGRLKKQQLDQNITAGQKMFSKKSVELGEDDEDEEEQNEDDLQEFYGKIKQNKSRKKSKSKERNPSKQSIKRMKQIQKVYLQRLDLPHRKQ